MDESHESLMYAHNGFPSGSLCAWAEGVDSALATKDREIAELRARVERLESKRPPQ